MIPDKDRRVKVMGGRGTNYVGGTVAWWEHVAAWRDYCQHYGYDQSAERILERGGFSLFELTEHLGHHPTTYKQNEV